jgi:alkylation response protein AidB-like acyl-CoA dehydrogenase
VTATFDEYGVAVSRAFDAAAAGDGVEARLRAVSAALAERSLLPRQARPGFCWQRRLVLYGKLAERGWTAVGTGAFVNDVVAGLLRDGTGPLGDFRRAMEAGSAVGAFAITELQSGGDLARMQTRADYARGGWTLNGEKSCIVNASFADVIVVVARNGASRGPFGQELLVVPADAPGVERGPLDSLGHRGALGWVRFRDVRLPDGCRLVGQDGPLALLYGALFDERLNIALRAAAMARVVLDRVARELARPCEGGNAGWRALQLAELHTEWLASFALARALAERAESVGSDGVLSALAKLDACRTFEHLSQRALELVDADGPCARTLRAALMDAVGLALSGGTEEVMLSIIANGIANSSSTSFHALT